MIRGGCGKGVPPQSWVGSGLPRKKNAIFPFEMYFGAFSAS